MEAERRGYHNFVTSTGEVYCFIGILLAHGVAAKGIPLKELWNQTWGISFFAKSMSRDRFLLLFKLLWFDGKVTRRRRLAHNKFALVSEIWRKFVHNCQICFSTSGFIAVEQLFPSKVRCRFIQFIPQKPDKYGIKFWLAVDCKSKYFLNGFPYLGKDEEWPASMTLGNYIIQKITGKKLFWGKGHNITCDSFFTSINSAKFLLTKKNQSLEQYETIDESCLLIYQRS